MTLDKIYKIEDPYSQHIEINLLISFLINEYRTSVQEIHNIIVRDMLERLFNSVVFKDETSFEIEEPSFLQYQQKFYKSHSELVKKTLIETIERLEFIKEEVLNSDSEVLLTPTSHSKWNWKGTIKELIEPFLVYAFLCIYCFYQSF